MYPFKPFYNNWLNVDSLFIDTTFQSDNVFPLITNLTMDFYESLKFDVDSLKNYRTDAVKKTVDMLGDKIALCFSGGVDSQCMVQAFAECEVNFDVYTLVFKNNLNIQDVKSARNYCNKNNIKLNEIELDVVRFLTFENYDYGIKYKSASPHFNTHYKLYDILADMGYTGVCSGGHPLAKNKDEYGINFTRNQLNFINYSQISGFPCQGSFLSFTPELAWSLCLLENDYNFDTDWKWKMGQMTSEQRLIRDKIIYDTKIQGYIRAGFNIIPQDQKYTGFEFVKTYFENLSGDGWEFEKRFREPLEKIFKAPHLTKLHLSDEILKKLKLIHNNNFLPSN